LKIFSTNQCSWTCYYCPPLTIVATWSDLPLKSLAVLEYSHNVGYKWFLLQPCWHQWVTNDKAMYWLLLEQLLPLVNGINGMLMAAAVISHCLAVCDLLMPTWLQQPFALHIALLQIIENVKRTTNSSGNNSQWMTITCPFILICGEHV